MQLLTMYTHPPTYTPLCVLLGSLTCLCPKDTHVLLFISAEITLHFLHNTLFHSLISKIWWNSCECKACEADWAGQLVCNAVTGRGRAKA